ncbi:hypothetical protein [Pseudanabaena sp. FACHB-2040]|uniref:hypothetical protein n=1 Tax=Pseudanabaena sp. FACHB-2040 TaxID=2692859 RepID=UPI0016831B74|nr:hypothetical protein [Pseudanabaena sp. FACHB-2040]MBD2259866.1 hypothetical protein [Pseudanabaena sp. FACHB-2040]
MPKSETDYSIGNSSRFWSRFTCRFLVGVALKGSAIAPTLAAAMTLSANAAPPPSLVPFMDQAKRQIIINAPVIVPYPHRYPTAPRQRVRVEFVAQGSDWGAVYLDNRLLYRPGNFNRRQGFWIDEGAYRLTITGVDQFEVWARGYLDVGRDDSNILVVTFSKNGGVSVSGSPYAWIPEGP